MSKENLNVQAELLQLEKRLSNELTSTNKDVEFLKKDHVSHKDLEIINRTLVDVLERVNDLEKADLELHREATKAEKDRFAFWITAFVSFAGSVIVAVLGFLLTKFF